MLPGKPERAQVLGDQVDHPLGPLEAAADVIAGASLATRR